MVRDRAHSGDDAPHDTWAPRTRRTGESRSGPDSAIRGAALSRTFESRVLVQWADVDIAGIMYFAAYQRAVERAEMDLFRELGFPYSEVFEKYDIWFPRVHVVADYFKPAAMEDWLNLRTTIYHVGTSSVKWKTVMRNERTGEDGAQMDVTVVCIDRDSHKSRPLPQEIRDALMACLDEVD